MAAAQAKPAPPGGGKKAGELFDQGSQLMSEGKFAQACEAFEASNRIEPSAGTLISLGQCREQNNQLASAVDAYQRALARVKDPRKRQYASAQIAGLRDRLSYLTVVVTSAVDLDGLVVSRGDVELTPVQWNQPVPIDGGDVVIAARAPDHAPWHTTVHIAATGAKVQVEVPVLPSASAPSSPESPTRDASSTTVTEEPRAWVTTPRLVALGLAGASVVSVIVGAALGVSANDKESEAFRLCPDMTGTGNQVMCTPANVDRANQLLQSSHHRATEANVAFGLAGGAAATAVVLWFVGAPAERSAQLGVAPRVAPGQTGLVVWGRF